MQSPSKPGKSPPAKWGDRVPPSADDKTKNANLAKENATLTRELGNYREEWVVVGIETHAPEKARLRIVENYKQALKLTDGLLKKTPEWSMALAMKALVLVRLGRRDEGMQLCARLEAIAQKLEGSGVGGGASAEAIKKLLDEQQKRWARARPARLAAPPWRRPRSQLAARAAGLLWLPLS